MSCQENSSISYGSTPPTSTKGIDTGGGTIEVEGCSVTFPPNSFSEAQSVKVKTSIGKKNEFPRVPGHIITPILHVSTCISKSSKEATMRLLTWCFPDGQNNIPEVEVYYFSREDKRWKLVNRLLLGDSGVIEFKHSIFSQYVALIPSKVQCSFYYKLQTSVYASHRNFVVALIVKSKFHENELDDRISRMKGKYQRLISVDFTCKRNSLIKSTISCESHENLTFCYPHPFSWNIDDFKRGGKSFLKRGELKSKSSPKDETLQMDDISLRFTVSRQDEAPIDKKFSYNCKPNEDMT